MARILSSHALLNHRLSAQVLDLASRTGVDGFELVSARHHFDYTNQEQLRELARWFQSSELAPWALEAPRGMDEVTEYSGGRFLALLSPDKSMRIDSMDEIKRALEAAYMIPFKHLALQIANREDQWSPRTEEYAITALEHLGAFTAPLGMSIVLKNSSYEAALPERLVEVLSHGHLRNIRIGLSVAESAASVGVEQSFETLGNRIAAVYLRDLAPNALSGDEKLWPGKGSIDWSEVRNLAARLDAEPDWVLSAIDVEAGVEQFPERVKDAFALIA